MSTRNKIRLRKERVEIISLMKTTSYYKKQLIGFEKKLSRAYEENRIDKEEYLRRLNEGLQGRTLRQWLRYYDQCINVYNTRVVEIDRELRELEKSRNLLPILTIFAFVALLGLSYYFIQPAITGFTLIENGTNATESVFGIQPVNINISEETGIIETTEIENDRLIQVKAEINKPVEWKLITRNKTIELPLEASNIEVNKLINETEDIKEKARLKNQFGANNLNNKKLIEVDELNETKLEVTYYTKAPYSIESNLTQNKDLISKDITIKSDSELHYQNVLSYTEIPESKTDQINLYHYINNEKIEVTNNQLYNVSYLDLNNNGLIDKLVWYVPQLSEQNFSVEISLTILTIQSYPAVGGNWTVLFNTTGTADLTIKASDETTWSNVNENNQLKFLEVKCENNIQNYNWVNDSVFIQNYSCNDSSKEVSKVFTRGKHSLQFTFGNITKYAYNDASGKTLISRGELTEIYDLGNGQKEIIIGTHNYYNITDGSYVPFDYNVTSLTADINGINLSWLDKSIFIKIYIKNKLGSKINISSLPVILKSNLNLSLSFEKTAQGFIYNHTLTKTISLQPMALGYDILPTNAACRVEGYKLICDEQVLSLENAALKQNLNITLADNFVEFSGNNLSKGSYIDLNYIDPEFNVTDSVTWCGTTENYTIIRILGSTTLSVCDYLGGESEDQNASSYNKGFNGTLYLTNLSEFILDTGSVLSGSGAGARGIKISVPGPGEGPGGGGKGSGLYGAGGGGYGGAGGVGYGSGGGSGGPAYANATNVTMFGSGGGSSNLDGGDGGGSIVINSSQTINISGKIENMGLNSDLINNNVCAGGGSGGGVWLITKNLVGNGFINISGGGGSGGPACPTGTDYAGGGGGGGRIYVQFSSNKSSIVNYILAGAGFSSGTVGTATYINKNNAPDNANTTIIPKTPSASSDLNCTYSFLDADNDNGTATIIWYNNTKEHFRTNITVSSNNTIVSYTLISNQTNGALGNQNWTCAARTNDQFINSANWVNASVLIDSTAPNLSLNSPINKTVTQNFSVTLNISVENNAAQLIIYAGNSSNLNYNNIVFLNKSILGADTHNFTYNFTSLPIKPTGTDGLKVLYHFDNITNFENSTSIYDWSLNNNNASCFSSIATLSCAFNYSGKYASSYPFDGLNDYLKTPYAYNQSEITVSFWLNPNFNAVDSSKSLNRLFVFDAAVNVTVLGTYNNMEDRFVLSVTNDTTWTNTGVLASATEVYSLLQSSDGTLYAGTGNNIVRVFKSTDNGTTWTNTGEIATGTKVHSILQSSDGTLYAGTGSTNGDVFKSTDNGTTWTGTGDLLSASTVWSLLQSSDGTLYAGTGTNGDVFKSTDNGTTWTNTGDLLSASTVDSLLQSSDGTLYAGTGSTNGDVFKSTDNGTTWTNTGDLLSASTVDSLLQSSDGTLYAGTGSTNGDVFKSTDNGTTWTNTGDLLSVGIVYSLLQSSDGTLYAGTGSGDVFKSTDNGTTWTNTGDLLSQTIVRSLLQSSDGTLYAGAGFKSSVGNVFKSTDNGTTWTNTGNLASTVWSLLQSSDGTLYAGTGSTNGEVFKINTTFIRSSTQTFNQGDWIHLLFILNNSGKKMFINAKEESSDTLPFSGISLSRILFGGDFYAQEGDGGYKSGTRNTYFNGSIDEVAIWNRSLSDTEITNLYNLTFGKYFWKANATDSAGNVNNTAIQEFNISLLPPNAVPEILFVENISTQSINENSFLNITVSFRVSDADGVSSIDFNRARLNLTKASHERSPIYNYTSSTSGGCFDSGDIDSTTANISCNAYIWYFDPAGQYNISVSYADGNNEFAQNITHNFTLASTIAILISPNNLTFGTSIFVGQDNLTSDNDPIEINNTGNVLISSGNVRITGRNLVGEVTKTQYIPAVNFTIEAVNKTTTNINAGCKNAASGSNATAFVNNTAAGITNSVLAIGNHSIQNGTSGQEHIFVCLIDVPMGLNPQSYSTLELGAWTLDII